MPPSAREAYAHLRAHRFFAAYPIELADEMGGRLAVSEFELVGHWSGFAMYHIRLHTGRTHQIRVHCAQSGCPIVGDSKYGAVQELPLSAPATHSIPLHLQAMELCFTDPYSGRLIHLRLDKPSAWRTPGDTGVSLTQ